MLIRQYETPSVVLTLGPSKHKHLYKICTTPAQRRRRWADVEQMFYECVVFAGDSVVELTQIKLTLAQCIMLARSQRTRYNYPVHCNMSIFICFYFFLSVVFSTPVAVFWDYHNPLTTKLMSWNFLSVEIVPRWRDSQLQVSDNYYSDLTEWRSTIQKPGCRIDVRF